MPSIPPPTARCFMQPAFFLANRNRWLLPGQSLVTPPTNRTTNGIAVPPPTLEHLFRDFLTTGNEAALELWMRRSGPPLRQLGLRLGASAEDVEDLVQETFVAAIQGADRYDATRPILPWLKGILTFRAARLARNEVRRRHHYEVSSRHKETSAPEPDLGHAELDHDVRKAIDDLPSQYREPLAQYLLAHRSPVEIANTMGVKRATVRVRLHRGLLRLRDALQRWGALLLSVFLGRRATAATMARVAVLILATVAITYGWPAEASAAAEQAKLTAAHAPISQESLPTPQSLNGTPPRTLASRLPMAAASGTTIHRTQFTVRVRGALGQLMPNIGITIEPAFGRDPVLHRRNMVTGIDGAVAWSSLPAGTWTLATDRGEETTVTIHPGAQSHTFTLAPTSPTLGVVIDTNGRPVANAAVWLSRGTDGPWRGQVVTHTDDAGRFELQSVPSGAFLAARHDQLARSAPCRVQQHSRKAPITLRLGPPGGRVVVRLADADGNAVADAVVYVGDSMDAAPLWLAQGAAPWRPPAFSGRTDAEGRLLAGSLEPGDHSVFVRARGHAPYRAVVHVDAWATCEHAIQLRPGAHLRGVVCDAEGSAIANAFVVFRHDNPSASIDAITAQDGSFEFDCLPTGSGQVLAKAPGFTAGITALFLEPNRQQCRVVLTGVVTYTGRLLIDGRAAPPGSQVQASWPPSATRDRATLVAIDEQGRFAFPSAADTTPALRIRLAGEPIWRDADTFAQWHGKELTITVPQDFVASSWISGCCTSDDGQPLQNARMYVCRDGKRWSEVGRTDHDGNYRLGPLAPASYRVFAESTQRTKPTLVAPPITLATNSSEHVNLTAQPTGEVEIQIGRNDDKPLTDVVMTLHRVDLHRRFAIANRPQLRQRLTAGEYVLAVMGSSVQWVDEHRFTVQPGATTTVALTLRAASNCTLILEGFPQRASGRATTISMHSISDPEWHPTVTLQPDAPLRLGAVMAPGSYWLEHIAWDGSSWHGSFAVASVREASQPIRVAMHCTDQVAPASNR